jgi:hypothetical protein
VKKNAFSIAYWLFFGVAQSVGMMLPRFANIHADPTPLLLGIAILLPGSLLGSFLPEGTNPWVHVVLMLAVNAVAWYIFFRFIRIRPEN